MEKVKKTITLIPESIKLIKLSDENYFKEYGEYISNSKLSLINPSEGGSIEKYLAGYSGEYSESFELGSAVHAIVLQPGEFEISGIHKPTGKLGLFADKAYPLLSEISDLHMDLTMDIINQASKEADYYSGKMTEKRVEAAMSACIPYWEKRREFEKSLSEDLLKKQVYVSAPIFEKYTKCLDSIKANPKIQDTFYPKGLLQNPEVYNEYAIFAEVDVTIGDKTTRLKLKSKLDNFTVDHENQEFTLNDLKTSGKPINYFMGNRVKTFTEETGEQWVWYDGSFQKFHYARQMGMYLWLLGCMLKHQGLDYKPKANMVVVNTIPDFRTKIFPVNGKHIREGLAEFKNLLILVTEWTNSQ